MNVAYLWDTCGDYIFYDVFVFICVAESGKWIKALDLLMKP